MDKSLIYLVFTDDWELRGDGSGDIESIQFEPMRRLLDIYERHGIRGTFMVELMQQLTFRAHQGEHPELKPLADRWDEHVRDACSRGHDIQLHIHPQWSDATYSEGKWHLAGLWELPTYPADLTRKMVAEGKAYLDRLLKPINPGYRCRAFRAGASAIGPGEFMLPTLVENGIDIDISIISGYRMKTLNLDIDFTRCVEGRLPYYPQMEDARQISSERQPIVCMPLFQFGASRRALAADIVAKGIAKLAASTGNGSDYSTAQWSSPDDGSVKRVLDKVVYPLVKGKSIVGDVGKLGARFLPEALPAARRHARASGRELFPVVLSNHSKYINDFAAIEKFVGEVASADDVHCVTLTVLSEMICEGQILARTLASKRG